MSVRRESPSGLTWIDKLDRVNTPDGTKARLRFAEIKQLPKSGLFAEELAATAPDIQAVVICVDTEVNLTGIDSLPLLSYLFIRECQAILPFSLASGGSLNLTRLAMPYAPGVTELLAASPHLRELEVEGGSLDMLRSMSGSVRELTLRRIKNALDNTAWDHLAPLDEVTINQSGSIVVKAPASSWPTHMEFTIIGSLKGLVQASRILPFNNLHLEGVRLLDKDASIWDLEAESTFISFGSKPPKWLVETWAHRPEDWADRLRVSYHPLLPGSEDQESGER